MGLFVWRQIQVFVYETTGKESQLEQACKMQADAISSQRIMRQPSDRQLNASGTLSIIKELVKWANEPNMTASETRSREGNCQGVNWFELVDDIHGLFW